MLSEEFSLRDEEHEDRRGQAEGLEVDPGIRGHGPPNDLVQDGQREEQGAEALEKPPIAKAVLLSSLPINGCAPRLWRCIANDLVRSRQLN